MVPKSKKEGGGSRERWKFWFHLVSGEYQDGFFINSEKRRGNPLQMEINSVDINCYLSARASKHHKLDEKISSYINFKQTKIERRNILKVDEIFSAMPKPLACKIMNFLKANKYHIRKDRMKIMEDTLKKYL